MPTLTLSGPAVVSSAFVGNQKKDLLTQLSKSRDELKIALEDLEESCYGFAEPDQDLKDRIKYLSQRISNLDTMEARLSDGSFLNKCKHSWCTKLIGFDRLMLSIEIRTCSKHT